MIFIGREADVFDAERHQAGHKKEYDARSTNAYVKSAAPTEPILAR
jgi:hypothetical protein